MWNILDKMWSVLMILPLLTATNGTPASFPEEAFHDDRIVGGSNTTIEKYPYQVSVHWGDVFTCGGSIISKHHVLTAAHCVLPDWGTSIMNVRAGSNFTYGGSRHHVTNATVHENYVKNEFNNPVYDVAVLRLREPFAWDKSRRAIEMFPAGRKAYMGDRAAITGWGKTENGLVRDIQLQLVEVPVVSTCMCNYAFQNKGGIGEGQICAALYGRGGKDACAGDSGGPLAIEGKLAGIVSYGEGCAEPEYPGVYTEVAFFRDWIDRVVAR